MSLSSEGLAVQDQGIGRLGVWRDLVLLLSLLAVGSFTGKGRNTLSSHSRRGTKLRGSFLIGWDDLLSSHGWSDAAGRQDFEASFCKGLDPMPPWLIAYQASNITTLGSVPTYESWMHHTFKVYYPALGPASACISQIQNAFFSSCYYPKH